MEKNTTEVTTPTPNMGETPLTDTQKWLLLIGLTGLAYYLLYKYR